MSRQLDNAKRWQAEASELLLDTPDPCNNIDRVVTIVNAQSICIDNLITAIEQLEAKPKATGHVSIELVRQAVRAARLGRQLDMINALHALGEELDAIDAASDPIGRISVEEAIERG